jgi:DNA-binding transcriptional ArsR family regulator
LILRKQSLKLFLVQTAIEAIAAPRRRDILRLVHGTELTAGAIAANFGDVSRPAISQHLRVLREAGLLRERRDGTRRLYSADPGGLDGLREFLERFWDERLETLKTEAEREERSRRHARGNRN